MQAPNRRLLRFIGLAFALYIGWYLVYDLWLAPKGQPDAWLNERVALDASYLLSAIGYEGSVSEGVQQTIIHIRKDSMVGVGNPCNGLELFALFAGFILCFPGNQKAKLWYIPLGILLIHLVNCIRAAGLALNQYHNPASLDFNHHYTFTIIVYAFIFYLWIRWVNRHSGWNSSEQNASNA